MTNAELGILLIAKDQASEVLGNVGEHFDRLGKAGEIAKVGLGLAAAGIGLAVELGHQFIEAAEAEQVAMFRLGSAVSNAADGVNIMADDLDNLLDSQRAVSGFTRVELANAVSLLTAQTGSYEQAVKRVAIAEDLARGTGMDLFAASKLMGKVTDENVKVLQRWGITVQKGAKEEELFALVEQKFGGQAASFAATSAGRWAIVADRIEEAKAKIGNGLLPLVDKMTDGIGKGIDIAGEFFGVITGSAPYAGEALKGVVGPEVASAIMGGIANLRNIWQMGWDAINVLQTGDLGALQDSVSEGTMQIGARLGAMWPMVRDAAARVFGQLVEAAPRIRDKLLDWAKAFVEWVWPATLELLHNLMTLANQAIAWVGDHADEIGDSLADWGGKFGEFIFTVAIPKFLEYAPKILETVGHWIVFEAGPKLAEALFHIGAKLAGRLGDAIGEAWTGIRDSIGYALQRAFAAIDFWVGPFHVSGVSGISVSMPDLHFPGFAEGGTVSRTGLALVHAGEQVLTPAQQAAGGQNGGGGIHLHFHGPVYGLNDFDQRVRQTVRDTALGGGFRGMLS